MSLDYLLIASREPAVTARLGRLDRSIAERSNIAGGTVQLHHGRPGLFVLTVDESAHPQDLRARSFTIFDGIGLFGNRLARGPDEIAKKLVKPSRDGWELRPSQRPAATLARGNFMIARHTRSRITLFADVLGTYPIFVYRTKTLFCASNNVFLVERALAELGIATTADLALHGYVVTLGNGAFDLTGFQEIRILAPGTMVEIDRENRARLLTSDLAPTIYSDRPLPELLDDAAHEILSAVRAVADAPFAHRVCDLTGGMDSRLVAAAILHEKRADDFLFFSAGSPPNPDVTVAALIRRAYGLRRVSHIDAVIPELGLFDAMRHYVARTSGCYSMLYGAGGVGQPITHDIIRLGGSFGETFRGYYGSVYGLRRKAVAAGKEPLDRLIRSVRKKSGLFLQGDRVPPHLHRLRKFARTMTAAGVQSADMPDVFYLRNRTRYHFGTQWRVSQRTRSVFHPLYSIAAIRAGYAMTMQDRTGNRVGHELMKRFCPTLLEIPFADDAWEPSLGVAPVTPVTRLSAPVDTDEEPTLELFDGGERKSEVASSRSAELRAEGRNKKWVDLETALQEFAPHASDSGFERLGPLFDPARVRAYLEQPISAFTTQLDAWTAYRLLGAYIWANRLEKGVR